METYYGYPRRNYSIYPYSNVNPDEYLNPYHHPVPNCNYFNPYHNSNPRSNPYCNRYPNPNPNPHQTPNSSPTMKPSTNPNPPSKPRVVSIPVHFVHSDSGASQLPTQPPAAVVSPQLLAEMAAVKLQKVIRGFLVRKSWSIVRKIEAEAEAIWEEIARDEAVLEKEVKARIRVGEMLMNLLFRLDSVRGVRDYRKKVIRKVISLQELVDSIGARREKVESDANTIEIERSDPAVDSVEIAKQNTVTPQIEENKMVTTVDSVEEIPINGTYSIDTNKGTEESNEGTKEGPDSDLEECVVVDEAVDPMKESPIEPVKSTEVPQIDKSREKQDASDEVFTEAKESAEVCDPTESLELDDNVTRSNTVDQAPEPSSQVDTYNQENNEMEMKGVREVMEKLVVESEKMKHLMEELCQSSARQWQLMEGLVNRVQRLEREVARMERRDKKKKKGRKNESSSKKCAQWNSC